MALTTLPTRTDDSLGRTKEDVRRPATLARAPNLATDVPAAEYNRVLDAVVALAEDVGIDDTPAEGTIKARLDDLEAGGGGGGVPTSREIATTAPLTGGGDLSANRTLAISAASGSAAGSMSAAHYTKVEGIEAGADVTDAANVAAAGALMTSSRSDATPAAVGTAAAGSSANVSRADHVHAHGNQAGGALHADATTSVAGFMSGADKTKLDGLAVRPTVESDANTTKTLADTDHDKIILATNAGGLEVTVPTGLTAGTTVEFVHADGGVGLVAGMGLTLLYPSTYLPQTAQESSTLVVTILSSTVAIVRGDLEAA